jgi:signal transduction histidine kinase/streptogramin lyase
LLEARDGAVWVFYEGLQVLRDGRWTRLTMPGTGERIIATAATESADGAVWIATRGHGVLRFANGRAEQFTERDGLSDAVATDVDVDEEGNVWIVTEAGLDRLRRAPFAPLGRTQGLPFDSPQWIAPDASGAIWAVAYPGLVLYRIDGGMVRGEPGQMTAKSMGSQAGTRYLTVAAARAGGVWVLDGQDRISRVKSDRFTPTYTVLDSYAIRVFENRRGELWVTARGLPLGWLSDGRWRRANIPNESDTALVTEINEDASGRMLIVKEGNPNLVVLDEDRIVRRLGPEQGLDRAIKNVVADGVDTLWADDGDSALYRIIGTNVSRVASAELVPYLRSRSVALLPSGDKFFIASSSGITSVSRATLHAAADAKAPFPRLRRYSSLDGARMARLTPQNASPAFRAADGRLWFSTPGGLLVFDARDAVPNRVAPRVHIEEVRAVDSILALDSVAAVPPGAERVEFRFTVTALRIPERARLEYRLDGVDANWRTADASRRVTYTQLRPRRYAFRVRAWNEDGVPAVAEAVLSLRVMPLWFQSWWFLSLATLAAIGAIAGGVVLMLLARARVAEDRLAAGFEAALAERTRLAGELHDTLLQAFTGVTLQLQALRSRILAAPEQVERDIGRVLTVADGALREARSAVWDIRAPELQGRDVAAALEELAQEAVDSHLLAGGAPVEIVVTVTGRHRRVSPAIETAAYRIAREAVGNALRHASAKRISLGIAFESRHLCLEARDDGVGFDASRVLPTEGRGHWGLVGMRERARNAGGTLDVTSVPGSGTTLVLRLPIDAA